MPVLKNAVLYFKEVVFSSEVSLYIGSKIPQFNVWLVNMSRDKSSMYMKVENVYFMWSSNP